MAIHSLTGICTLFLGLVLLSGCASDNNNDSSSTGLNLSIPEGAVSFNAGNAEDSTTQAVSKTSDLSTAPLSVVSTPAPPGMAFINLFGQISQSNREVSQPVTGASGSYTHTCDTGTYSDSWNGTETSGSGTLKYSMCQYSGITFDGAADYSWNDTANTSTGSANGSLTMLLDTDTQFSIAFNMSMTSNYETGKFTLVLNYSIGGIPGLGYLFETVEPLTGTLYDSVDSGVVMLSGANGTRVRVTFLGSNNVKVELDEGTGTFSEINNNHPIPALYAPFY